MKAILFPQANKVLKAPPDEHAAARAEIQAGLDALAAGGADISDLQAELDARCPKPVDCYDLHVWGGEVEGIPRCISCWDPSPEDRALIAAGGPIWLWAVGHTHPPLVLDTAHPFEERHESPASLLPPGEALALAGKLLHRLADDGRMVSLRAVREEIPLEPTPIFEGAKAMCQRHRKGRLLILIEEVEEGESVPSPNTESRPDLIAIAEAKEAALHFKETWPLADRPGGEVEKP